MINIQFNGFPDFVPAQPKKQPPVQAFKYLAINMLTLGLFNAVNHLSSQYRIRKLEGKQVQLLKQAIDLAASWDELANRLKRLQDDFNNLENPEAGELNNEIDRLKGEVQRLTLDRSNLYQHAVVDGVDGQPQANLRQLVMMISSFVCQIFSNLSIISLYSIFQNDHLKNRISILKSQNRYIRGKAADLKEERNQALQQQINFFTSRLDREREFGVLGRGEGIELFRQLTAQRKETATLQAQHKAAEEQLEGLNAQYIVTQQAEENLEVFRGALNDATANNENIQKQMDVVLAENNRLREERNAKERELAGIRNQLLSAAQRVAHMRGLEEQIGRLQGGAALLNLQSRLGPIPFKYAPSAEEIELAKAGDAGVDDVSETNKENWSSYAQLYNGLDTADDVFKAGFSHALNKLFEMAAEKEEQVPLQNLNVPFGPPDLVMDLEPEVQVNVPAARRQKIMLNEKPLGTPESPGAQAVYRFLALEWLKGGRIVANCHGNELHLNNKSVNLLPSRPEKMLELKNAGDRQELCVITHFQQRDDFTPSEETLSTTSAASGIDPIAAKCLLAKLSAEEQEHLFNLLMDPVIEDDHPDYQRTQEFMRVIPQERVQIIHTLCQLIGDMAVVFQTKFKNTIAAELWNDYLDAENFDLQPFRKEKAEEWELNFQLPENFGARPIVEWKLNEGLLALRRGGVGVGEQEDFNLLIKNAKERYQRYFNNLKPELLLRQLDEGVEIERVSLQNLNPLYHKCHQLIGDEGCLFSNLLAILINDQNQLNSLNVRKLKKAMAAFLDDPKHAEMFKAALLNDHGLEIPHYQQWLRGEPGAPHIDSKNLTPLQIDLAAHSIGIRIALFTLPESHADERHTKGKVDRYGKLVPVEDVYGNYFGPHTQEVLFLAAINNHTYYGLFPRLDLEGEEATSLDLNDLQALEDIAYYWQTIQNNRN